MATLKELVDETTKIKNELVTCHTNLKTNLSNKGISISSSEKLSKLVSKVNSLQNIGDVKKGTTVDVLVENLDLPTPTFNYTQYTFKDASFHETDTELFIFLTYNTSGSSTNIMSTIYKYNKSSKTWTSKDILKNSTNSSTYALCSLFYGDYLYYSNGSGSIARVSLSTFEQVNALSVRYGYRLDHLVVYNNYLYFTSSKFDSDTSAGIHRLDLDLTNLKSVTGTGRAYTTGAITINRFTNTIYWACGGYDGGTSYKLDLDLNVLTKYTSSTIFYCDYTGVCTSSAMLLVKANKIDLINLSNDTVTKSYTVPSHSSATAIIKISESSSYTGFYHRGHFNHMSISEKGVIKRLQLGEESLIYATGENEFYILDYFKLIKIKRLVI